MLLARTSFDCCLIQHQNKAAERGDKQRTTALTWKAKSRFLLAASRSFLKSSISVRNLRFSALDAEYIWNSENQTEVIRDPHEPSWTLGSWCRLLDRMRVSGDGPGPSVWPQHYWAFWTLSPAEQNTLLSELWSSIDLSDQKRILVHCRIFAELLTTLCLFSIVKPWPQTLIP